MVRSWTGATFLAGLLGCVDPASTGANLGQLALGPADIHIVGTSDGITKIVDVMPAPDGAA